LEHHIQGLMLCLAQDLYTSN